MSAPPAVEIPLPDGWERLDGEDRPAGGRRRLGSGAALRVDVVARDGAHQVRIAVEGADGDPRVYPVTASEDPAAAVARAGRLCRRLEAGVASGEVTGDPASLRPAIRDVAGEGLLGAFVRALRP